MKPSLLRASVALAAGVAVAVAGTAGASPTKQLVVKDVASDANAVNEQGLAGGTIGNDNAAPVSSPSHDILSVTYARTGTAKACTGFTATLELAAAPVNAVIYRLLAVGTVTDMFWLQYSVTPSAGEVATLRYRDGTEETPLASKTIPVKVVKNGAKITFVVDAATITKTTEKPAKFALNNIGAEVRGNTGAATVPVIDTVPVQEGRSFKPCAK